MKFIKRRHHQPERGVLADDTFEQLELAFHERLCKDREALTVLGMALARAIGNPVPALEELRTFAHRLRGAAAICGVVDLRDAAQDLEVAAFAAPQAPDDPTHGAVWSAFILLADVLASMTESTTSIPLTEEPLRESKRS